MAAHQLRVGVWVLCIHAAISGMACGDLLPDITSGPLTVKLSQVATGISGAEPTTGVQQYLPTDFVLPNDGSGRRFVTTLGGLVRVIDGTGSLLATPYLNTTNANTQVDAQHFGMTAMVFHPGFTDAGSAGYRKFYTVTTEVFNAGPADFSASHLIMGDTTRRPQNVLTEWTVDDVNANVFSGASREVMRIQQPNRDHNINHLMFDDQGLLYITAGDGGNTGNSIGPTYSDNAPDLTKVFGKVLRIDPTDTAGGQKYGIPDDNPFVGVPLALPEIYTYGHRNPYRISRDDVTGNIYIGEVGQTQVEEINGLVSGGNFGWNLKEGSFLYNKNDQNNPQIDPDLDNSGVGDVAEALNLIEPLLEYDHTEGRSVTGGFVYRGSSIPWLYGKYVFADYLGTDNTSRLFVGNLTTGTIQQLNIDLSGSPLLRNVLSIGQDESGELYLVGLKANNSGTVLKLLPSSINFQLGDTDGDMDVDIDDLTNVKNSFGQLGPASMGDADGDGDTDIQDFVAVKNNMGVVPPPGLTDVPEPATGVLIIAAGLVLGRRNVL